MNRASLRHLLIAAAWAGALALGGCQRDAGSSPAPAATASTPAPADDRVFAPLIGRWRIDTIGASKVMGLELSSDGTRIWWEPGCAGQGRAFEVRQGRFAVIPSTGPDVVCEIGVPSDLSRVWDLLDSANRIEVTDTGRATIDGGIGALRLMRIAAAPQRKPQIELSGAAAVTSLAGEWRVAGIDGKPLDGPTGLALRGDANQLWWEPRCAGLVRNYAISGERLVIGTAARPAAVSEPGAPRQPRPVCAIGLPPQLTGVLRALDSAQRIRRTPSNGIEISGGGHSLLLFSQ